MSLFRRFRVVISASSLSNTAEQTSSVVGVAARMAFSTASVREQMSVRGGWT